MGVDFKDLVPKIPVKLEDLGGKIIAIDAYNAIYQFLSIIRQPDGTPLKDSTGKITSHLSGLLYRTSNLVEMGIKPIYVFDGIPPTLKAVEIERRRQVKVQAIASYEKAAVQGDTNKMRMFAQASTSMKDYMQEDSRKLLELMGLPWIQAPSEGEAQAAHMTKRGDSDYCASQDYDSILFGAPKLLRNMTISGRRKLPSKGIYIDVVPEVIELSKALNRDWSNLRTVNRCGHFSRHRLQSRRNKRAGTKNRFKTHQAIRHFGECSSKIKNASFPVEPNCIREVFLHPEVTNKYKLEWKEPNLEGIIDFMCRQKEFSEDRVRKSVEKMLEGSRKQKAKMTLEKWFG